MFSRALHRLNVFPRLAQVECFPMLGTVLIFSRAWHWFMFFRDWHRLNVFPRLAQVEYFPALDSDCIVLRRVLQLFRGFFVLVVLFRSYLIIGSYYLFWFSYSRYNSFHCEVHLNNCTKFAYKTTHHHRPLHCTIF